MDSSSPVHLQPPDSEGIFRAMADPTRQRLLQVLTISELNVSELVEILGQPQSTVSRHLRVLRESGLVLDRRHGTAALYSASGNNGSGSEETHNLSAMMHEWLASRPVPSILQERLNKVLKHRDSAVDGFFNRLGRRWDELREAAFGQAFAMEAFISLLPRTWTVADIGTGTGYLLPVLASHFAHVIAIDPAEAMLECARQRVDEHGAGNVSFHQGDLTTLRIASESCDLAIAMLVLHHVRDPEAALAELFRVLRPGGRVLIVEQHAHHNPAFHERMQDLWWGFEPEELCVQLANAGFEDVRHWRLEMTNGAADAPPLFVTTGNRVA